MRLTQHHQSGLTLSTQKNSKERLINKRLKARQNKTSIRQILSFFCYLKKNGNTFHSFDSDVQSREVVRGFSLQQICVYIYEWDFSSLPFVFNGSLDAVGQECT